MDIRDFWTLVERTRAASDGTDAGHAALLEQSLAGLGKQACIDFENRLNELIAALCTFEVLAANFIIQSYLSDDGFMDFRAWLVAQGRARYEDAKRDVSSIAGWLEREAVDAMDGARFLMVGLDAYTALGGDEDDYYDAISFPNEADFDEDWPDDVEGFHARWPALYEKFWNQERIDELHPDEE
jgi:hypothetical protein